MLTLKHRQPRRWEVAAYKAPHRLDTTYLGRIVGLPGETVELVDGDLFINNERIVKPADQYESMWAFVHDSSFVPKIPIKDQPRWQANPPESGTQQADGKWILKTDFVAALQFNGEITADLEYAMGRQGRYYNTVSDVRIDVDVDAMSTKGSLSIAWLRGDIDVSATFKSNGRCSLESANQATADTYKIDDGLAGKRIGLAMRDGVASLLVDDKVMTTLIIGPQKLPPQGGALRDDEPVRCSIVVNALDAHATLGRILIRRDVHYLSDGAKLGRNCQGCTNNPIRLSANEFFSLGDNSPFANDGRRWHEIDPSLQGRFQLGSVPDELMVGVAHWVYWPLHRARAIND